MTTERKNILNKVNQLIDKRKEELIKKLLDNNEFESVFKYMPTNSF